MFFLTESKVQHEKSLVNENISWTLLKQNIIKFLKTKRNQSKMSEITIEKQKYALRTYYQSIYRQCEEFIEKSYKNIETERMLTQLYNESLGSVRNLCPGLILSIEKIPVSNSSFADISNLYKLKIECSKIIHLLEFDSKSQIPEKFINKLTSLKEEFENEEIVDHDLTKNIIYAIDLFEKGELLASAIVVSRAVSYILNQFRSDNSISNKIKSMKEKTNSIPFEELILERCIELKIIVKNEQNKVFFKNFMTYCKKSRDLLTHDISYNQSPSDVLALLSNSIQLISLKKKFDLNTITESAEDSN